jgi:hypothetical protein
MQYLKSKTMWFAMILAALSAAQGLLDLITDPKMHAVSGIVVAACIAGLRVVTTMPLNEK